MLRRCSPWIVWPPLHTPPSQSPAASPSSHARREPASTAPRRAPRAVLAALAISSILALEPPLVRAQEQLALTATELTGPAAGTADLLLSNDSAVEGVTVAVSYDGALVEILAITDDATVTAAAGAEGFFPEILPASAGWLLGIFLDTMPPFDGQTIPAGSDQVIARVELAATPAATPGTSATLSFVDGLLGSPPVDNTVTLAGGTVIGAPQGLVLSDGAVDFLAGVLHFSLTDATAGPGAPAVCELRLDENLGAVTGYAAAISFPIDLDLIGIDIDGTDAELAGADTVVTESGDDWGTLQVAVDAVPPFTGSAIPVGSDLHLGNFLFTCDSHPWLPDPAVVYAVTLSDIPGPLEVTFDGMSATPTTSDGSVTCTAIAPPDTIYYLGATDEPGGEVHALAGIPGETLTLEFLYSEPSDEIQGFQIAICADCALFLGSEFDITDTIVEAVGAEFIGSQADNDPLDGDGCEFTVGVLLDALPPFDGQAIPPTLVPLRLGATTVTIDDAADAGSELLIDYCDFIDGSGQTPIENIVVIDFDSIPVIDREGTSVTVLGSTSFRRGDANDDGAHDVADCVALLTHYTQGFPASSCFAASDADANGTLDLADFFLLAQHLFLDGPPLPAPYPTCGDDPGADCESYTSCL